MGGGCERSDLGHGVAAVWPTSAPMNRLGGPRTITTFESDFDRQRVIAPGASDSME